MGTRVEKAQIISVKDLPNGSERLIQDMIAEDPSVLKLGNLILRDKERTQPSGGRLDILLRDEETGESWYEVEIQLGATNETHIIRTIEYWNRERRRYPDVRHPAVIVAEEINGRFFNVVSLFNQHIALDADDELVEYCVVDWLKIRVRKSVYKNSKKIEPGYSIIKAARRAQKAA